MKKSILMLIALFMLGACSTFCDFSTPDDTTTVETPETPETTEGEGTEDTEGEDTEGEGTEGEDTEGEGAEGEDTEGEDTEGEGTEGEDTEGEDTEGEDTEGEGAEGEGTEDTEGESTEETFVIKLDELSADPEYNNFDVTDEDSNNWTYTADGVTYTFKESASSDEATFSYESGYGIIYSVAVTLDEDIAITKEDNVAEVYLGIASGVYNTCNNGNQYSAKLSEGGEILQVATDSGATIQYAFIESTVEHTDDTISVIYARYNSNGKTAYFECILYLAASRICRTTDSVQRTDNDIYDLGS